MVSDVIYAILQVVPFVSLLRIPGEQVRSRAGAVPLRWEVRLRVPFDADDPVDLIFQLRKRIRSGRIPMIMVDALGASVIVLDRGQAARSTGYLAARVAIF